MANLVYKRSTTTSLKTAGLIDVENMTITVDGEDKKLSRLWKDFEGSEVEIVIKVKVDEDIPEPTASDEEDV
jgi:hypothetical protein|nr:MAG TPA: YonK protein [Caudoviricetes sp.]DAZ33992.1 MAG TPA: YonK protein [Caudoviricetes sp.]DAZ46013.1 MAG TPA: YonK protein [Caudoviricetes sp.]